MGEARIGNFDQQGDVLRPALAVLNRALARAMAAPRIERRARGLALAWGGSGAPLDSVSDAVARAAATLLTSDRLARLRECAADECGWLFLDQSRNGSRRWCDMSLCGNRAKARAFQRRRRES